MRATSPPRYGVTEPGARGPATTVGSSLAAWMPATSDRSLVAKNAVHTSPVAASRATAASEPQQSASGSAASADEPAGPRCHRTPVVPVLATHKGAPPTSTASNP